MANTWSCLFPRPSSHLYFIGKKRKAWERDKYYNFILTDHVGQRIWHHTCQMSHWSAKERKDEDRNDSHTHKKIWNPQLLSYLGRPQRVASNFSQDHTMRRVLEKSKILQLARKSTLKKTSPSSPGSEDNAAKFKLTQGMENQSLGCLTVSL